MSSRAVETLETGKQFRTVRHGSEIVEGPILSMTG